MTMRSLSVAVVGVPFALAACADAIVRPDAIASAVNPSSVKYTVYPARTLLSSSALVEGALRTQRYNDAGNNIGLETLWPTPDVSKFEWSGNRVVLLTTAGTLYARDRVSDFVAIATDVADFQLEDNLIAARHVDGLLRVKEGIHGPWTAVASQVAGFQLEGTRIGALHEDGRLRVKEGIHGPWLEVASEVERFQLEGQRIGVLQRPSHGHSESHIAVQHEDDDDDEEGNRKVRGTLSIKTSLNAPWTPVATRVAEFQLEGSRIGILTKNRHGDDDEDDDDAVGDGGSTDGLSFHGDDDDDDHDPVRRERLTLWVKDGVDAAWSELANHITAFQLEGNRIAMLDKKGVVRVQDGIVGTATEIATDAVAVQLQGSVIGVLWADGLRLRDGIAGAWTALRTSFAGATQMRLLVDVPLAFRSTPASYQTQANLCDAQYDEGKDGDGFYKCYPEYQFGVIVGKYGRFCGAGVPSDGNWDWAHGQGVIDPIDGLCREHDHASWYGIDPNNFRYHACVVRYGIENDRLTVDGVDVAEGSAAWDAAWALMPRTLDARTAWHQESSGPEACTASLLEEFTAATASTR